MWNIQLSKEQRIETLNQLALTTGYAHFAIEKTVITLFKNTIYEYIQKRSVITVTVKLSFIDWQIL